MPIKKIASLKKPFAPLYEINLLLFQKKQFLVKKITFLTIFTRNNY